MDSAYQDRIVNCVDTATTRIVVLRCRWGPPLLTWTIYGCTYLSRCKHMDTNNVKCGHVDPAYLPPSKELAHPSQRPTTKELSLQLQSNVRSRNKVLSIRECEQ
eukprot:scaffold1557_cov108-Isochrysis_galbana.AAC.8